MGGARRDSLDGIEDIPSAASTVRPRPDAVDAAKVAPGNSRVKDDLRAHPRQESGAGGQGYFGVAI
jgi:hypothetical protein